MYETVCHIACDTVQKLPDDENGSLLHLCCRHEAGLLQMHQGRNERTTSLAQAHAAFTLQASTRHPLPKNRQQLCNVDVSFQHPDDLRVLAGLQQPQQVGCLTLHVREHASGLNLPPVPLAHTHVVQLQRFSAMRVLCLSGHIIIDGTLFEVLAHHSPALQALSIDAYLSLEARDGDADAQLTALQVCVWLRCV